MTLAGRRVLITGGSRGLGLAVARRFVQEGANVVIAAREGDALAAAVDGLRGLVGGPFRQIAALVADVSSESAVADLTAFALDRLGGIDVLVANAGIHGDIGPFEGCDWNAWRSAIETNLFGTALCCRAVLPGMRAAGYGKIMALSGGGAANARPYFSAYAASKTAVVRLVETLAVELAGTGVDINAIAPGAMNTRLLDEQLRAGPERIGEDAWNQAWLQACNLPATPDAPVDLAVFLASSASDGISGRMISAVWDDWRAPGFREALADPEAGTLRRVKPAVKEVAA